MRPANWPAVEPDHHPDRRPTVFPNQDGVIVHCDPDDDLDRVDDPDDDRCDCRDDD